MIRNEVLIALLLLSPFIGFLINAFRRKIKCHKVSGTIATSAIFISFVCCILAFFRLLEKDAGQRQLTANYFNWISIGDFHVNASFLVDEVSIIMGLIITGVGTLIHLFSIGYMSEDNRPSQYFAYLNLFIFYMLILVLGSNLPVMFIGWEGVGLCSYLLIGFWFSDAQKAAAGMKAFIMNRIGDAALILGMFLIFINIGSLDFLEINTFATQFLEGGEKASLWWCIAALLLFIGATGKSAQIPLYTWLPDAMAGPTPVSALIHAATMVTAGVYMIIRLNVFYLVTPLAMTVIAVVGVVTAVFAASIGLLQNDIKKILAYSTISQLGYMFLAVGVGAFSSALFHLMTHAFFKALMFLGAGSVIHSMKGEQDIRKMGGLRKDMPITHSTFVMGWLAIIGFPFFSGFFSKDEVLWMSYHSPRGDIVFWILGVLGAGLTAFYMTRLMSLTFWGEKSKGFKGHPHESPFVMTLPLILLGFLSIIGGYVGIPHFLGHFPHLLENWLPKVPLPGLTPADTRVELLMMSISVSVALLSAGFAFWVYVKRRDHFSLSVGFQKVHKLIANKYWVDEGYDKFIVRPFIYLSRKLWEIIDIGFIDKTTYRITDLIRSSGVSLGHLQSGNLQQYAMYMLLGVAIVSIILISMI